MSELWILIWVVGVQFCPPESSKLCQKWHESYSYELFTSSELALVKYDELVETNNRKPIDYFLYKIDSQWVITPRRKNVLYEINLLKRSVQK